MTADIGEMFCPVCKVPMLKVTAMLVERRALLASRVGYVVHDFWVQVALAVALSYVTSPVALRHLTPWSEEE